MPIYEYLCQWCGTTKEFIVKPGEIYSVECPGCEHPEMTRQMSAHGGYKIKGDNSASTKPSQSGSFKGKK